MHPVTYLFVGMSIVLFVVLVIEVVMSVRAWRARRQLRMPMKEGVMNEIVICEVHGTVRDVTKEPCWSCERERSESIRVSGGKYSFIKRGQSIVIDRHGEPWHQQQDAFNAISSMMHELDAARVVLEAARALDANGEAPMCLRDALKHHGSLVEDNEKPSGWAK